MRMIVAGGGTGGHFFPGLAVAEEAVRGGSTVTFVGSRSGIEARLAPQRGFAFIPLEIHGVRGTGWRGAARFLLQFPIALVRSFRLVADADVVLGLGGYGSVPIVAGAWLRRVPAVLMEQNVHPGFANRLLARLARRICTSFEDRDHFFPADKAVRTGNPVRQLASDRRPDPAHFTVLVIGGSQGARSLNRAMVAAVEALRERLPQLRVVHQTGVADHASVEQRYRELAVDATATAFIDDMAAAYAGADLVVCRSGATTIAELTMLGKASILVPYPFAADDHQRHNAEALVARGAAEIILDRDLTGAALADRIVHYSSHRADLQRMGLAALALATPDATRAVLRACLEAAGERP